MSRSASESSENCSRKDGPGFIHRFSDIPIVKSAFSQVSSAYSIAKERNVVTKLSLSLVELSIKTAVETTKLAYRVILKPGFVETLTKEVEKKSVQVDALACKSLDVLQEKCPSIMSEPAEILASGADALEKSEILDAALIVGEAAVDYISWPSTKTEVHDHDIKPMAVSSKKVDRIKIMSQRTGVALYQGGYKVFWGVAGAPFNATKAAINVTHQAATGTFHMTRDIVLHIPGLSTLITSKRKPRRSKRVPVRRQPAGIPVSPSKKRKRSNGENSSENGSLYEKIFVDQPYLSEEDPDYSPEEPTSDTDSEEESSDADSVGESSDTVGCSDEDDSGEGDEAETSEAGGQALTADQLKRTVRFEDGHVIHGPKGSLIVQISDSKQSTEVHVTEKETRKLAKGSGPVDATTKTNEIIPTSIKEEAKSTKSDATKTLSQKSPKTKPPSSTEKKAEHFPSKYVAKVTKMNTSGAVRETGEEMKAAIYKEPQSPKQKDEKVTSTSTTSNKEVAKSTKSDATKTISQKSPKTKPSPATEKKAEHLPTKYITHFPKTTKINTSGAVGGPGEELKAASHKELQSPKQKIENQDVSCSDRSDGKTDETTQKK